VPALQRFFSTFPGGWPALGLLLLRLAVSTNSFIEGIALLNVQGASGFPILPAGVALVLASISLALGFLTPVFSALAALSFVASEVTLHHLPIVHPFGDFVATGDFITIAIALTCLGPGAVSLDARLFGRREIIIPDTLRPPLK